VKNRKTYRFRRVFGILLALFTLLSACSRQKAAGTRSGAELRYGFASEPATFDPLNPANTADGRSILFNVFEGLVKPGTDGQLLPCLAESWTIEQGGAAYNFQLREGVLFHDGSGLTAADVKFTLDTAAAAGFEGFTQVEKTEIPDSRTVRITLKYPDPEFLPYLTVGIVKDGSTGREKNAVGTGPYRIENYKAQQSLTLKKFEGYWQQGLPYFEKVTIVFFADSSALVLGLQGGSIDGATITSALAQQLNPQRFDLAPGFSASVQMLALNNAVKPLDDIHVRQAVNYSIDVQGIIDMAFFGRGEPSGSPLIPGLAAYYEKSLANAYPADTGTAQSLLAQAGYGEGEKKLTLEITVPSNFTMHIDTAQVIVGQLAKAGISANIKLVDWATWLKDVYQNRDYQATIISLDAKTVSPRAFLSRYQSSADNNFINFNNSAFDRVYSAALAEVDEEKRIALYREAQQIISDNAASVYIQDIVGFKAFRGGAYGGALNYPLYVIDFASMYGTEK
jgi:peptide/nickel transport system substrate-binding protein